MYLWHWGNWLSQQCVYDYAKLPFCYRPAKVTHSPNQCVAMAASDIQCVVQGGAGPADCADSWNSDTVTRLPPTCFVMGHPRKCFEEGVYEKSRAALPLATQFVFQPGARAFGGWGSCHDRAFVEGYEQVQIHWGICSPSRSDWCNISCCDRWCGFRPS